MVSLGCFVGVNGLLVTWAALGTRTIVSRIPATLLAGAALTIAVFIGVIWLGDTTPDYIGLVGSLAVLPMLFAVAQLPLWIARVSYGWRFVHEVSRTESRTFPREEIGTSHIAVAAVWSAVALAMAKWGLDLVASRPAWWPFAFLLSSGFLIGVLGLMPCLWAVFSGRRNSWATSMLGVYFTMMTLVAAGVLQHTLGSSSIVAFASFQLGVFAVLLLGLRLLRAMGFSVATIR
jgi:hypothetical protein